MAWYNPTDPTQRNWMLGGLVMLLLAGLFYQFYLPPRNEANDVIRDRLESLNDEATDANEATRDAQAAFEAFLASQRGLPVTSASRDRRIRLNGLLDRALDHEGKLGEQVQRLEREIRRESWETLSRVR